MNVITKIESANYAASLTDVEALASQVVSGVHANGTYLRVLVVVAQSLLGKPRRGAKQLDQVAAVNSAHESLYPAVLRGVSRGEPDLASAELQRRATFARTAASALRRYAEHSDVRTLDVLQVTKRALSPERKSSSRVETVAHITERLVKTLDLLTADDAAAGRAAIESALGELESRLAALDQSEHQSTRTTVGTPQFRYPATGRAQRPAVHA